MRFKNRDELVTLARILHERSAVSRRKPTGDPRTVAKPIALESGGAQVAIFLVVIAFLLAIQNEPNHVGGILVVERGW